MNLLPDHGKDEIRVAGGEKPQLALTSLKDALSQQPAGAYRNLRLLHLKSFSLGISRRVNKCQDVFGLMLRQKVF